MASTIDELIASRTFFAPRAAGWEERFPDDDPRFAQAIAELAPAAGGVALDVGCGSGRALPWLRGAVGPAGRVLACDLTPEMLAEADRLGRGPLASLVLADAGRLPLAPATADAVLAAGLLPHVRDPGAVLAELARVTRAGGRLAVFHPLSRAALAARHGGVPSDDDVLASGRLSSLLAATGWALRSLDDGPERYLALAQRR